MKGFSWFNEIIAFKHPDRRRRDPFLTFCRWWGCAPQAGFAVLSPVILVTLAMAALDAVGEGGSCHDCGSLGWGGTGSA